jgi:hypothetical protein
LIALVKDSLNGNVALDRDDQGFFRVTILPDLAYSLFRIAQEQAWKKGAKIVIVPSQIVLRNREDGQFVYEQYLELQKLVDDVSDIYDVEDNEEKKIVRRKMEEIRNFLKKNRDYVVSTSFQDIITDSDRIKDNSYYQGSDQIVIGKRDNEKTKESDLTAKIEHEKGHRADRARKEIHFNDGKNSTREDEEKSAEFWRRYNSGVKEYVAADKFDKEIFAFDRQIKNLMIDRMYNESRHFDTIGRVNGYMSEHNIDNVFYEDDTSLAERIVVFLERQYRDPMYYDDYDDEEITRYNSDPDASEVVVDANDWYQRNREQSDFLQDAAQNSWEVYGEALEQSSDLLTEKQLEAYRMVESPQYENFRRNHRKEYGEFLKQIYNAGDDHYKLREIGWHKRERRSIINDISC